MKLAIVGGRDFKDYVLFTGYFDYYFKEETNTIISGGAKGADSFAKCIAEHYHISYLEFPADWRKYGKYAGPHRNQQIVYACDKVLVFWDGKSRGTKNTIDLARAAKKPTFIVYY